MSTTTNAQITEQASAFRAEAERLGFRVGAHGEIVTISKSFEPGDRAAYVAADGDGPCLLASVPTVKGGSTWGTDGASIGGHAGLLGGYYRLNRSGVSRRFVKALGGS